jgi:CRISPR-associated protein Csh1
MRLFAEGVAALYPHAHPMSLGSVYHLIPVRKTDKGQVNVQRVLSFYRSLLSGEMVYSKTLIGYAVEALDKGLRQLSKQKADNYENLNLSYYREGKEDFFIKHLIMSYLVLFRVLGSLNSWKGRFL